MTAETPDLLTLGARMRYAAGVLEEASERYCWKSGDWKPVELRREAEVLEAEDRETAERDAMADELARAILEAQRALQPSNRRYSAWGNAPERLQDLCRGIAHHLIEYGYHKDAS